MKLTDRSCGSSDRTCASSSSSSNSAARTAGGRNKSYLALANRCARVKCALHGEFAIAVKRNVAGGSFDIRHGRWEAPISSLLVALALVQGGATWLGIEATRLDNQCTSACSHVHALAGNTRRRASLARLHHTHTCRLCTANMPLPILPTPSRNTSRGVRPPECL